MPISEFPRRLVLEVVLVAYVCYSLADASQGFSFKIHKPFDNMVCNETLGPYGHYSVESCAGMCSFVSECEGFSFLKQAKFCRMCTQSVYTLSRSLEDLAGATTYLLPCSREWDYFDGSCYYLDIRRTNFFNAKAVCENLAIGGHLIYIETQAEKEFIISLMGTKYPAGVGANKVWVGGQDSNTNVFRWFDGNVVGYTGFSDWYPGEPSNIAGENYLTAVPSHNYVWSDDLWNRAYPSLCEVPSQWD